MQIASTQHAQNGLIDHPCMPVEAILMLYE